MSLLLRLALMALVPAAAWWWHGGFGDVRGALAAAGWRGLAAVALWHGLSVGLCGLAWSLLVPQAPAWRFLLARGLRDGVNQMLAFVPLAGEVVGARLLTRGGLPTATAAAATVVDLTAEALAQGVFSLLGVGIWMALHPASAATRWGMVGVAASVPVLAGLVLAQRGGPLRLLETLPERLLPGRWSSPGIHEAVGRLWQGRWRVAGSTGVHLLAWLVATGEAWIALRLLGAPLPLAEVVALESMVFAIRSAAFVVPAGWGVQEGSYVVLGAALGMPAELALALALLKRGRELVWGLPTLVLWQALRLPSASSGTS